MLPGHYAPFCSKDNASVTNEGDYGDEIASGDFRRCLCRDSMKGCRGIGKVEYFSDVRRRCLNVTCYVNVSIWV